MAGPVFKPFPGISSSDWEPPYERAVIYLQNSKALRVMQENQNVSHLIFPKGNVSFFH
jgi:hypothetical protein